MMDPNACLDCILRTAKTLADGEGNAHEAMKLAEHVLALNGWIQGGGFLPRLWQQNERDRLDKLEE
jgi:hypothetical protein